MTTLLAVVVPTLVGGALSQLGSASASAPAVTSESTELVLLAPAPSVTSTVQESPSLPLVVRVPGPDPAAPTTTSSVAPVLDRMAIWYSLADCETGVWSVGKVPVPGSARWSILSRGYQGGLQFHPTTWDQTRQPGDAEDAQLAPPARQIAVAELVLARQGVKAWPTCGSRVGLGALLSSAPTNPDYGFPAGDPTVLYEGSIGGLTPP